MARHAIPAATVNLSASVSVDVLWVTACSPVLTAPVLAVRRFSHKLMLLVEAVLAEVAQFSVRPDRFAVQQCAFRRNMNARVVLFRILYGAHCCAPRVHWLRRPGSCFLKVLEQTSHASFVQQQCWHSASHLDASDSCGRQLAAKRYANTAFEQPYNRAAYTADVLLEARRWHTVEYEAVVGGLRADDLTVRDVSTWGAPGSSHV